MWKGKVWDDQIASFSNALKLFSDHFPGEKDLNKYATVARWG